MTEAGRRRAPLPPIGRVASDPDSLSATAGWPDMPIGDKLDPRRFTGMSPKMAALVAYVLGDEAVFHTEPEIVEIIRLSDGALLARHDGEVGTSTVIGHIHDFDRNWGALIAAAELTPEEIGHIHRLLDSRVKGFSRDGSHP